MAHPVLQVQSILVATREVCILVAQYATSPPRIQKTKFSNGLDAPEWQARGFSPKSIEVIEQFSAFSCASVSVSQLPSPQCFYGFFIMIAVFEIP